MNLWTGLIAGLTLSLALPLAVQAQAGSSPVYGNWKLNLAKSTFDPGPAPQSQMRTYEAAPDGFSKVTVQTTTASGQVQTRSSTYKEDGKPYPIVGSPNYDETIDTPINPFRTETALLRFGKVIGHLIVVKSKDYKVLTVTFALTTPSGQSEHDVLVFDRQ
jgi:hypothetical protein